jgi:hypothetical protein
VFVEIQQSFLVGHGITRLEGCPTLRKGFPELGALDT